MIVAKLSPSPSEKGLSKIDNHGETANCEPQTARASENKIYDFVGSWNSVWRVYST